MIKWITALLGYTYFRFGERSGLFLGEYFRAVFKGQNQNPFKVFSFNGCVPNKYSSICFLLRLLSLKPMGRSMSVNSVCAQLFIANYGEEYASTIFSKINTEVNKKSQNLNELTRLFVQGARYETRLQILHFLFGIANTDAILLRLRFKKFNKLPVL